MKLNSNIIPTLIISLSLLVDKSLSQNKYCEITCKLKLRDVGMNGVFMYQNHTMCNFAPCTLKQRCGRGGRILENNQMHRMYFLDGHNRWRSLVSEGKISKHPPASNMMALNYDFELEKIAECFAATCGEFGLRDNCLRTIDNKPMGQNMYKRTSRSTNKDFESKDFIDRVLTEWQSESKDMKTEYISSFPALPKIGFYGNTSDLLEINYGKVYKWTQMIWAKTTSVGCARVVSRASESASKEIVFVYCNYGVAGNMIGEPIYQQGNPYSGCKSNVGRDEAYPGLCKNEKGHYKSVPSTNTSCNGNKTNTEFGLNNFVKGHYQNTSRQILPEKNAFYFHYERTNARNALKYNFALSFLFASVLCICAFFPFVWNQQLKLLI